MKLLGWNCRGICNTSTVRALKALVGGHSPEVVVFLCETKASTAKMELVKRKLHFDEFCCVEAVGWAGGLCLFWQKHVDLQVTYRNKNIIVVVIFNAAERPWLLSLCHSPAYSSQKA